MSFHENSEPEQVGVVAPGVGTTKVNREEAVLKDFCYQFLPSAGAAQRIVHTCGLVPAQIRTTHSCSTRAHVLKKHDTYQAYHIKEHDFQSQIK